MPARQRPEICLRILCETIAVEKRSSFFGWLISNAYQSRLMNCPSIRSRILAFGLAFASLQGFLGLSVCDTSNTHAVDRNSAIATTPDIATNASNGTSRRSILPTGWRRTTRGWERAEAWGNDGSAIGFEAIGTHAYRTRFSVVGGTQPQTVGQWMLWDEAREPVWANRLMGEVRRVHPLFVAVFLIAVAVLITRLSEPSTSQPPVRRVSE